MATRAGVEAAFKLIHSTLPPTPVLTSSTLDEMVGCKIYWKCEHLQKTGSFKARGALYNVSLLKERGAKGVITHSSGNHGQAVAWAARKLGLPCTVVVPQNAPATKVEAIKGYGAQLARCGNAITDRESECARLAAELGYEIIEPFDRKETIEGQGTLGLEMAQQIDDVDAIFVSVGGGGLASGLSLAFPSKRLYLVEPEGKMLQLQLDGAHGDDRSALRTVADGIRVRVIGENNRMVLKAHEDKAIINVTDEEIREALILIWTRLKQHVEPTAAVAFAGLRRLATEGPLPFKTAAIILCGGNVDVSFVP